MEHLTEKEAFDAMVLFLEKFYAITESDDVGALLGSMMVLEDRGTADPAVWGSGSIASTKSSEAGEASQTDFRESD
jgi:hypothetical protein